MTIGFIGIGKMGLPMARRLLGAGVELLVWSRTAASCDALVASGAARADSVDGVFERCDVVLMMLLDERAVDAVLGRGTFAFGARVAGRLVATLGTTSPDYSRSLGEDIRAHGGRYVEAPVSGSRIPAEEGALVGMLAGDDDAVAIVETQLAPMCRTVVRCGAVPSALRTKLAVNHYLIVIVAALAEAFEAARAAGVDAELFQRVLDSGPMASTISRSKLAKLVATDFSPQAAIRDVAEIARLVRGQARGAEVDAALIEAAAVMFEAAHARGLGDFDMSAVLQPASPST